MKKAVLKVRFFLSGSFKVHIYILSLFPTIIADQRSLSLEKQRATPAETLSFVLQWSDANQISPPGPHTVFSRLQIICLGQKVDLAAARHSAKPSCTNAWGYRDSTVEKM